MAHCGCRNHLRKPKQMHKSREAAVTAILTRHIHHGPHKIIECPRQPGVFHVVSEKEKK